MKEVLVLIKTNNRSKVGNMVGNMIDLSPTIIINIIVDGGVVRRLLL
jgi:hypothetical protein